MTSMVWKPDVTVAAIAERAHNLLAQMGVVDHQLCQPCSRQPFNMPNNQRLAASFKQRLGGMVGKRPHAFTPACGQ